VSTANTMITRALRLGRVIGRDETPSADESADGLDALNGMLESWSTERLFAYAIRDESFSWAASAASRTVGAAGDFVTDRPDRVDESSYFSTGGGIDYGVTLITGDTYSAIPVKTITNSFPKFLFVDYTSSALVTLYAFEVPSATITFHLRSWKILQSFSALTTTVALPAGYRRAIEYSLAEEICSEYGVEIPPMVAAIARKARSNIKRINAPSPVMRSEVGYMSRGPIAGKCLW
jgi:hypothetical protein